MILLDFETRSDCDLRKAGAVAYAQHPSTVVLCMSYKKDHNAIQRLTPDGRNSTFLRYEDDDRNEREIRERVEWLNALDIGEGVTYAAHNISFERAILKYVLGIETSLYDWED